MKKTLTLLVKTMTMTTMETMVNETPLSIDGPQFHPARPRHLPGIHRQHTARRSASPDTRQHYTIPRTLPSNSPNARRPRPSSKLSTLRLIRQRIALIPSTSRFTLLREPSSDGWGSYECIQSVYLFFRFFLVHVSRGTRCERRRRRQMVFSVRLLDVFGHPHFLTYM